MRAGFPRIRSDSSRTAFVEAESLWTYHVNMRLAGRFIRREAILAAVDTYQLVEAYPDDRYLPSYLLLARHGSEAFHMLFAADVEGDNVRVVTSYRPDPGEWQADFKTRRPKL